MDSSEAAVLERPPAVRKVVEYVSRNGDGRPSGPDFELREDMRLWVWYVPCYTPWERRRYLDD